MVRSVLLVTAGSVLVLSACSNPIPANDSAPQANSQAVARPAVAPTTPSDRLLAAAEPFEALTETAFTAAPADLDRTLADGRRAVTDVRPLLGSSDATKVDTLLAQIDRYRSGGKPADVALSSIEIYRVLVSSVPASTKVPVDVSLLDYAGFRFQADLKSDPIRWGDMKQAVGFALDRWAELAPKVTDTAVSKPFEDALATMKRAADNRDLTLARSAVTAELDQVDKLEAYFSAK